MSAPGASPPASSAPPAPAADLHHHPRLLGEEGCVQLVAGDVDAPALVAGEGHLQQGDDEAAVAHVVARHDGPAPDQVLHRLEDRVQSGRILDVGSFVAELAEDLGERAAAQAAPVSHREQQQRCCRSS